MLDKPEWPIYTGYFFAFLAIWSVLEAHSGALRSSLEAPSVWACAWGLVRLSLFTLALVSVIAFFWRGYSFSRYTVLLFWMLHMGVGVATAAGLRAWLRRQSDAQATWVWVAGSGSAERACRECVTPRGRVVVTRFADLQTVLRALEEFDAPSAVGELIVVVPSREGHGIEGLASALDLLPLRAAIAVEGLPVESANATPSFVLFSIGPRAAAEVEYIVGKRLLDFCASIAGLLLLGPLMLLVATVTVLRSGRPVLIAQERVGGGGRRFRLIKFRSLPVVSLASSDREWSPARADGWGRFLRRTGLDELPQLVNVLKGEMSLVGPRPERPLFVEQFRRQLPFYSARHRLRSGITGWAQVNGWRGDTSIRRRVEHDLYYLRHWSLGFDVRILWLTLKQFARQLSTPKGNQEATPDARPV